MEFDLDPENRFGHKDGLAKLGAGLTWGTSKLNLKGKQLLVKLMAYFDKRRYKRFYA